MAGSLYDWLPGPVAEILRGGLPEALDSGVSGLRSNPEQNTGRVPPTPGTDNARVPNRMNNAASLISGQNIALAGVAIVLVVVLAKRL